MSKRRVQLRLPYQASEDVLVLARTIKAALMPTYRVVVQLSEEGFENDDITPVESTLEPLLVVWLSDKG